MKQTIREFDVRDLTVALPFQPNEIQLLREREGVSQAVFARCLNITTTHLSALECGRKRPSGPLLKLLWLIEKNGLDSVL